jgi:predicted N-acetyltransferase YhbS
LVSVGGRAIATGRVFLETSGYATLARIAVLPQFRGTGIGPIVVNELESIAREHGSSRFSLHPHVHLERFYGAMGYTTVPGSESSVGEHRLITMSKTIDVAVGQGPDVDVEGA